jgi:hypothetical protein
MNISTIIDTVNGILVGRGRVKRDEGEGLWLMDFICI